VTGGGAASGDVTGGGAASGHVTGGGAASGDVTGGGAASGDVTGGGAAGGAHLHTVVSERGVHRLVCVQHVQRHILAVPQPRGLHSLTFQLNVSAFGGIGGVVRDCLGGV